MIMNNILKKMNEEEKKKENLAVKKDNIAVVKHINVEPTKNEFEFHEKSKSSTNPKLLRDFNKKMLDKIKSQNLNLHGFSKTQNRPTQANENILKNEMKKFISNKFPQKDIGRFTEKESTIITMDKESDDSEQQDTGEEAMDLTNKVSSEINIENMLSNMKLNQGEAIEYIGTSIGSPFLSKKIKHRGRKSNDDKRLHLHDVNQNATFFIEKKIHKLAKNETVVAIRRNMIGKKEGVEISNQNNTTTLSLSKKTQTSDPSLSALSKFPKLNQTATATATVIDKKDLQFKSTQVPMLDDLSDIKPPPSNEITPEPVIDKESETFALLNTMINDPPFSFLEMNDKVYDVNVDELDENIVKLIREYSLKNFEIQRTGRHRSRFPDPQWDCAEAQVTKLVRYLCEEEISATYQKYCRPILEQINTMIESHLYQDNNLEICQNIHMCPVTVDVQ